MSFSSGGAAEETLSYYIRAYDLGSPIFRAFRTEVETTSRAVTASMAEMNRALASQSVVSRDLTATQSAVSTGNLKMQRSMQDAGAAATAMGGNLRSASGEADKHAASLKNMEAETGRARSATAAASTEIQKHKNVIEQAGYALQAYSGQLGPFGRSLDQAAKHAALFRSQGIDYISAGLVGGAAALTAYGVHAQQTFEQVTRSIQQQTGASSAATQKLLADVKQVATDSPASYQAIGQAVGAQYKLFGDNNAQIQKNTELYLAFADQAKTSVIPAITNISNVMRLFKPAGMDSVGVMDQLVKLSQNSQQPLNTYLTILSHFGPQLKAMGFSFTDTIGLFDELSKHGITASQMGRGLASAMSTAEKQIKAATTAQADGQQKMLQYTDAVDQAQIKVNTLNTEIAAGKGSTQKYSDQLQIANNQLTLAKGKLEAETLAVHNSGLAHLTVSQVIAQETKAIEGAKTKNDALNLSVQAFGTRLGPQMADALWHNQGGLAAMDKAMGSTTDATKKLADAAKGTLSAQLTILSHDFSNMAAPLAQDVLPGLEEMVKLLGDVAKAAAGLPHGLLEGLVAGGAGLGAASLVMRHTPLGGAASRALGLDSSGALSALLTGKSGTGQALAAGGSGGALGGVGGGLTGINMTGRMVGSVENPIAVRSVGGEGLGGSSSFSTGSNTSRLAGSGTTAAETAAAGAAGGEAAVVERTVGSTLKGALGGLLRGGIITAGGLAATSAASSIIGGSAGRTVSTLGTDASIGAGVGSILGPMGALGGAAGGVLVGGIGQLFKSDSPQWFETVDANAKKYGVRVAASLTDSMPQAIANRYAIGIASAAGDAKQAQGYAQHYAQQAGPGAVPALTVPAGSGIGAAEQSAVQGVKLQAANLAAVWGQAATADLIQEGQKAANAFAAEFANVKHPTAFSIVTAFQDQMGQLPTTARNTAGATMLQWAAGLAANGNLSKTQFAQTISDMEAQVPGFAAYMKNSAINTPDLFISADTQSKLQARLQDTLSGMEQQFMYTVPKVKADFSDPFMANITSAYDFMKSYTKTATGQALRDADANMRQLQQLTDQHLTLTEQQTSAHMAAIASSVKSGSAAASAQAVIYWDQYQTTIQSAEKAGVLTVQAGNKLIGQEMVKALQALGVPAGDAKALAATGLSFNTISSVINQGASPAPVAGTPRMGGAATGARVPGAVSGDSWTLVDPTGRPAAKVGGGELLIANRHTEAAASAATLAMYGQTLGSMVAGERTPHSYATGGYVDPIPGFTIGRTDMGVDANAAPGTPIVAIGDSRLAGVQQNWYAGQPLLDFQLTNGADAGRYWYVAEQITPVTERIGAQFKAGQVVARYAPSGTGIEIGWAANASGTTAAQASGQTGDSSHGNSPMGVAFHSFLSGLAQGKLVGGGPGMASIATPQVKGGGVMGAIAQGAINQIAQAANQKLAASSATGGLNFAGVTGTGGTAGANQALGKQMMLAAGWPASQWPYLQALWTQESGWNANSVNPSSGAYGIPQSLGHGHPYNLGDPQAQIAWGLNYIKGRYGSPAAAEAHEQAFNWYARGGRVAGFNDHMDGRAFHETGRFQSAGAFAGGGQFTATQPTVALFGEKGTETAYFVPGDGNQGAQADMHSALVQPGTYPTSSTTTKGHKPPKVHYSTRLNHLTGQIETHTTAEWQVITAEYAKQRADAAAEKKKYDAWLAQQTDVSLLSGAPGSASFTLPGQPGSPVGGLVGSLSATRKQLNVYGLPQHGPFDIASGVSVDKLTDKGMAAVSTALTKAFGAEGIGQLLRTAQILATAGQHNAREASLAALAIKAGLSDVTSTFSSQQQRYGDATGLMTTIEGLRAGTTARGMGLNATQLKSLGITGRQFGALAGTNMGGTGTAASYTAEANYIQHTEMPGYESDAKRLERLYVDALKARNSKLAASLLSQLNAVTKAEVTANQQLQQDKINAIKTTAANYSTMSSFVGSMAGLQAGIQGLAPGTDLGFDPKVAAMLGLGAGAAGTEGTSVSYLQNQLQTTGAPLSGAQMAGAAGGVASQNSLVQTQIAPLQAELSYYQQQVSSGALSGQDAIDAVNTMQGLASNIVTLDGTITSNNQALQALTVANIQATAAISANQAAFQGNAAGALGSIQGLAPGTSLASIGLDPATLQLAGIDPNQAASLEGSGMSYLQAAQQKQGGVLTPAQLAAAQAGTGAQNAMLQGEIGSDSQSLQTWESNLPSLTGTDRTNAISTIQGLVQTILGLQGTIQSNNDALASLTTATNANTTATGQMTGTVGYSYQGQNYVAGGSMTSDSPQNISMGL